MSKKYTARVRVSFSVYYDLAIPTDNPDPSDSAILKKICGKDIFYYENGDGFGLNEVILEQEGIEVEHVDWDADPTATGKQRVTKDWEITIDENQKEKHHV